MAIDALSEPRLLVDVPDALSYLHLPERQKTTAHRRLSFTLAAVLIAVLILGFIPYLQPAQKTVVQVKKNCPIEKRIATENTPQKQEQQQNTKRDISMRHYRQVSEEPLRQVQEKYDVNKQSQAQRLVAVNHEMPLTARFQNKKPESSQLVSQRDRHADPVEPEDPASTVIVVAAWEEPQVPYNVEVEVRNPDSGMVSIHSESRDEDGTEREQSISVKTNANTLDNGRTEL
jgi:hypothetical protein